MQKYTQEQTTKIIDIIIANCQKISKVSYCKVYMWMFGQTVTTKFMEAVLRHIGHGKYVPPLEKNEIIIIIAPSDGRSGIVFAVNGVYYKTFMESAWYVDYEDCHRSSFYKSDERYSAEVLEQIFEQIHHVLKQNEVKQYSDNKVVEKEDNNDNIIPESNKDSDEVDSKYWIQADSTTDIVEKLRLLEEGAAQGGRLCYTELGEMYLAGNGVPKNLEVAEEYFLKAAKLGTPPAMVSLSLLYANWDGENYYSESLDWLCEAAKRGFLPAFIVIEKKFSVEGKDYSVDSFINEITRRMKPRFEMIMKKEDKDCSDYEFLGLCYIYGVVCDKDEQKARSYIEKAADMGSTNSCVMLRWPHLRCDVQNPDVSAEGKNTSNSIEEKEAVLNKTSNKDSAVVNSASVNEQINTDGSAKIMSVASLVVGILGIYVGTEIRSDIFLLITTIVGLFLGIKGIKKGKKIVAIAGMILNILLLNEALHNLF